MSDRMNAEADPELQAARAALSLEGGSLQRYAVRLSEVVMQQHAARKKDWTSWQAKEDELNDEIRSLRHEMHAEQQERDQAMGREVLLEQELRAERRRRIDLEAQVTLADSWKAPDGVDFDTSLWMKGTLERKERNNGSLVCTN